MEDLTARQKKFCEYYAQSGNTVQSAIKSGYSEKYANGRGYELLEKVGIKKYITELTEKAKDERILSAKDRQAILSDIANNNDNGLTDRIKAIDTLNKMTGEYLNRVEFNGNMAVQILSDINDEEDS